MILLSVIILTLAGCAKEEVAEMDVAVNDVIEESTEITEEETTESLSEETVEETTENPIEAGTDESAVQEEQTNISNTEQQGDSTPETTQLEQKDTANAEEPEAEEPQKQETEKDSQSSSDKGADCESDTKQPEQTPAEPEKQEPVKEPEAEEPKQAVSYDPNQVVALATEKTKAAGKISIPEDLDSMLANGEITKEEYDAYYPYDGAGYYSVFVETDLNEAATTSGRKLGSVEGIADYISGMLALETGPYFYIEYTGITNTGGRDFYEFRCYRA